MKGKLPVRLEEQDTTELLVEIGEHVEELTGIGVQDGDGHLWLASDHDLAVFKHQAISHRLPPLPSEEPKPSLESCQVEIETRANSILRGPRHQLEVLFKNKCEVPIPVTAARLAWTYTPLREMPSQPGKPSIAEAGGSVSLSPQSRSKEVRPGEEMLFVLDDEMSSCLVELLRGDVRDEDISIEVDTSTGQGWKANMDGIPEAVRAVAQTVLRSLHNQQH